MERQLQGDAGLEVLDADAPAHDSERVGGVVERQSAGSIATVDGGSGGLTDSERKSRKRFNATLDVVLLREVSAREPYAAPHGKVNETWEEVTNALNNSGSFPWKVDSRMARDRFVILERWLKKHDIENLRRGAGEVFELREHLLNDVVTRKDSIHMAKEEKRGDRDVKKERAQPVVVSMADRKRNIGGYSEDSEAKRARESHTVEDFIAYLKEKDQSWREFERKRLELDELRMQADISDQKKQRELEDKRLSIEKVKLNQASEERKLLYQILHAIQGKTSSGEVPSNPEVP